MTTSESSDMAERIQHAYVLAHDSLGHDHTLTKVLAEQCERIEALRSQVLHTRILGTLEVFGPMTGKDLLAFVVCPLCHTNDERIVDVLAALISEERVTLDDDTKVFSLVV